MYIMAEELFLLSQPKPMELPIATIVGGDVTLQSLKQDYGILLESIKIQRENYGEFCEHEQELNDTLGPIEKDPEPYSNGTIKTRPILKKYAICLCEKLDFELRIEALEEELRDVDLTPQEVKADMKRYITICEKKIASQQELYEQLQEEMKQLTDGNKVIISELQEQIKQLNDVVKVIISDPRDTYKTLLTHCAMTDTKSLDYFIPLSKIEKPDISSLHYAVYGKKIESVQKLLDAGANVNFKSVLFMNGNHVYEQGKFTPLEIASRVCSLELVKLLIDYGATTSDVNDFRVPNGTEGDLVAGYLQTHGSKHVVRFN